MNTALRPHPCIPVRREAHRTMCRVCPLPCSNRVHVEREDIPPDDRYEQQREEDSDAEA